MPRWPGGLVRAMPLTPAPGGASGMWTLAEQAQARAEGNWPVVEVPATVAYVTTAQTTGTQSSFTFSGVNIGTAATGRRIIVAAGNAFTAFTIDSMSIGGNAATEVIEAGEVGEDSITVRTALYILQVDSGTTADIVVNVNTSIGGMWIAVWAAYGLNNSTATDTMSSTADPLTGAIDVDAGGILVAAATIYDNSGAPTIAWAGANEDFDSTISAATTKTGASKQFASAVVSETITCTPSGSGSEAMVAASFR